VGGKATSEAKLPTNSTRDCWILRVLLEAGKKEYLRGRSGVSNIAWGGELNAKMFAGKRTKQKRFSTEPVLSKKGRPKIYTRFRSP
jgi:hypothetical protein